MSEPEEKKLAKPARSSCQRRQIDPAPFAAELRSLYERLLDLEDRIRWLENTRTARPQVK